MAAVTWFGNYFPPGEAGTTTGGLTAAEVWAFAGPRTLTVPACAASGTELTGAAITARRGDSFSLTLTGLGSLAGRTNLWFTVKRREGEPDSASQIQMTETGGLLVIAGAAAEAGNGSLTVDDEALGVVTIDLDEDETAKMIIDRAFIWDIQMATATTVTTRGTGTLTFMADVTLATG